MSSLIPGYSEPILIDRLSVQSVELGILVSIERSETAARAPELYRLLRETCSISPITNQLLTNAENAHISNQLFNRIARSMTAPPVYQRMDLYETWIHAHDELIISFGGNPDAMYFNSQ